MTKPVFMKEKKKNNQNLILCHVSISGRVQGVFYRLNTIKRAQSLGISGWVTNCPDGRVEAVIVGPENKISQMIAWFWQGPKLAKVEKVEIISQEEVDRNPFPNFSCQKEVPR